MVELIEKNDDPDNLFTGRSIEEIGAIEQKIRGDIERKREELRQMVGERYRDLIEAADTITNMKKHSLKMIENIERLKSLQQNPVSSNEVSNSESEKLSRRFDETTATIKLLTILPECISKITTRKHRGNDLKGISRAAMCYLLGQTVTKQLGLDSPASGILAVIPILTARMNHLESAKQNLVLMSRKILSSSDLTEEDAVDALHALSMIENIEDFNYIETFIKCRSDGLELLLTEDSMNPTEQISEMGFNLRNTVKLFANLFMCSSASPLSHSSTATVTEIIGSKSELWTRFLPANVNNWAISINDRAKYVPLDDKSNQEIVSKWLYKARDDIAQHMPKKLQCFNTGADLNALRQSLEASIAPTHREAHSLGDWMIYVNRVFGSPLDLRNFFFNVPFNLRLKQIITSDLADIQRSTQQILTKAILDSVKDTNYDFSISSPIWNQEVEEPSISSNSVDWAKKNLSLRAKSYHPTIICGIKQASKRLAKLLPDVKAFTSDKLILKTEAAKFIEEFCTFCENFHDQEPKSPEKSLLIGRCCYAIGELCPELEMSLCDDWHSSKDKLQSQGDIGVVKWIGKS